MPLSLPIQDEGFTLREFVPVDTECLADIEFDPAVKRYLAMPNKPKEEWIESVRRVGIRGWVIETEDGQLVGRAELVRAKRKGDAEIRVVIGKRFWGRAFGSRAAALLVRIAFEQLSAKAVIGIVHPENRASLRLLRSLHFRRRGVVPEKAESWDVGHLVYRLSRRAYNPSLQPTACGGG